MPVPCSCWTRRSTSAWRWGVRLTSGGRSWPSMVSTWLVTALMALISFRSKSSRTSSQLIRSRQRGAEVAVALSSPSGSSIERTLTLSGPNAGTTTMHATTWCSPPPAESRPRMSVTAGLLQTVNLDELCCFFSWLFDHMKLSTAWQSRW